MNDPILPIKETWALMEAAEEQALEAFNDFVDSLNRPYVEKLEREQGVGNFVMPNPSRGEGDPADRCLRLLGTMCPVGAGIWFHVDAVRVLRGDDGVLRLHTVGEDEYNFEDHLKLMEAVDENVSYQTVEFGPWDYVVMIYPYGD